jgi:hypothetical protein
MMSNFKARFKRWLGFPYWEYNTEKVIIKPRKILSYGFTISYDKRDAQFILDALNFYNISHSSQAKREYSLSMEANDKRQLDFETNDLKTAISFKDFMIANSKTKMHYEFDIQPTSNEYQDELSKVQVVGTQKQNEGILLKLDLIKNIKNNEV